MYRRTKYIPAKFSFHTNWGLLLAFILAFVFALFLQVLLSQPRVPRTRPDIASIYYTTFVLLFFSLLYIVYYFRQKVVMTSDDITLVKLRSTNTIHWNRVNRIKLRFSMSSLQLLFSPLFGQRGTLLFELMFGDQIIKYTFANTSAEDVNVFLEQLATLSPRAPKVSQPYTKNFWSASQEWDWGFQVVKYL